MNLIAYQAFGVEHLQIFAGLGFIGIGLKLAKSAVWTMVLAWKIAFRSAFGPQSQDWAAAHMWLLLVYWGAFIAGAAALVFRRSAQSRPMLLVLLYLIVGITFLSVLGRGYAHVSDIEYSPRYAYIQSLAFVALYVILIDETKLLALRLAQGVRGRLLRTAVGRIAPALPLVLLVIHYSLLNSQPSPGYYHQAHPENGRIVRKFFQDLAEVERERGSRSGIYLVAQKKDDWAIVIDTRKNGSE